MKRKIPRSDSYSADIISSLVGSRQPLPPRIKLSDNPPPTPTVRPDTLPAVAAASGHKRQRLWQIRGGIRGGVVLRMAEDKSRFPPLCAEPAAQEPRLLV